MASVTEIGIRIAAEIVSLKDKASDIVRVKVETKEEESESETESVWVNFALNVWDKTSPSVKPSATDVV